MYVITKYDKRCIDFHKDRIVEICKIKKDVMCKIEELEHKKNISYDNEFTKKICDKMYDFEIDAHKVYLDDLDFRINDELEEIECLWNGSHIETMAKILLKRIGEE